MATIPLSQSWRTKRTSRTTWGPLANGDSGAADTSGRLSDKSVQITGTFGAGGSVTLQGSNDGTNWATLTKADGTTAATFTSAGMAQILENPEFIRPTVTAGDGTTALTVQLFCSSTAS